MSTAAEVAEVHVQNLLTGNADELRDVLRAVLTDYHSDPEQCPACDVVNDPCPYHRGVEAGYAGAMRQIGAYAWRLGNNHDEREQFQNKEATR